MSLTIEQILAKSEALIAEVRENSIPPARVGELFQGLALLFQNFPSEQTLIYELIKENSNKELTDTNILSSLRVLKEIQDAIKDIHLGDVLEDLIDVFNGLYLSKVNADVAAGRITFADGLNAYEFLQGQFMGSGMGVYKDENQNTVLETDKLVVRKSAIFNEIIINQIKFQGGIYIYSAANLEVSDFEELEDEWKIYFDTKNAQIKNLFVIDDQIRCQRFSGGNIIKYYMSVVTEVGADYICISKTDYDGEILVEIGDAIVQFGNRTDTSRQSLIEINVIGGGKQTFYQNVNSYVLSNKNYIEIGRVFDNTIFGTETWLNMMRIFGNLYVGSRNQSSYLKYNEDTETVELRGKVVAKGSGGDVDLSDWVDLTDETLNGLDKELSITLSPDSVTLPALSNGTGTNLTNAQTSVKVFRGGKELFPNLDSSIKDVNLMKNSTRLDQIVIPIEDSDLAIDNNQSVPEWYATDAVYIEGSNEKIGGTWANTRFYIVLYDGLGGTVPTHNKHFSISFYVCNNNAFESLFVNSNVGNRMTEILPNEKKLVVWNDIIGEEYIAGEDGIDNYNSFQIQVRAGSVDGVAMCTLWRPMIVEGTKVPDVWRINPSEIFLTSTITPTNCSYSTIDTNKVKITSVASDKDTGSVDIRFNYGGVLAEKRLSWGKAKAGTDGTDGQDGVNPPLLYLTSTAEAMTFNENNNPNPSTQTITFTAILRNITGTAIFTAIPYIGTSAQTAITLGGSGNTRTLTQAQWGATVDRIEIMATLGTLTDMITIVKLKDGASGENAITGYLTNESATFPATSSGVVTDFSNANSNFKVFNGITDVTTSATFSKVSNTGCTASITFSGGISVSAMSADNATAVFRAVYGGVTIDKVLTLSKSKKGTDGEDGEHGVSVVSVTPQYVLTNKDAATPAINNPNWSNVRPDYEDDKWLWTRQKTLFSDNNIDYSPAVRDTSWELYQGMVIGGVNLVKNGNFVNGLHKWNKNGSFVLNRLNGSDVPKDALAAIEMDIGELNINSGVWQPFKNKSNESLIPLDTNYTLSFMARATSAFRILRFGLEGNALKDVTLTTSWQTYKYTFKPTAAGNLIFYARNAGKFWITNIQLELGNQATAFKNGYLEDALKNDTEINGGLVLSTVVAVRDDDNIVRSYISGLTGANGDDTAFAAGVENFGEETETKMIDLRHNGDFFIGENNPQYRFAIKNAENSLFDNAFDGIDYFEAHDGFEYDNFETKRTENNPATIFTSVDFNAPFSLKYNSYVTFYISSLVGYTLKSGYSQVPSYTINENYLRVINTVTNTVVWTSVENGNVDIGLEINERKYLPIGSYKVEGRISLQLLGAYADVASTFAEIAVNTAFFEIDVLQHIIGRKGIRLADNVHNKTFDLNLANPNLLSARGGFQWFSQNYSNRLQIADDGLKIKGNTDIPGVLASGSVASNGGQSNTWGAKVNDSNITPSGGSYTIPHNIGHGNYSVQITPGTAGRIAYVSTKNIDSVVVVLTNTSGSGVKTDFDYMIVGNN